jgi:hypothetical protein
LAGDLGAVTGSVMMGVLASAFAATSAHSMRSTVPTNFSRAASHAFVNGFHFENGMPAEYLSRSVIFAM